MGERLPRHWTMDDEIAMFGEGATGKQQQKNKHKKVGRCGRKGNCGKKENNEKDGFEAVVAEAATEVLEDGFEKVVVDTENSGDEGWMEVGDDEAMASPGNNKKGKNNKHG